MDPLYSMEVTKLHIKFIYPKFDKLIETYPELVQYEVYLGLGDFKMPPAQGIPILVNLLPDDIQWTVEDQNIQEINYHDDADLIVISFFTPQAGYAYEIGDKFLQLGKPVIMGGMHPSMIPDDVKPHCTSICIGEADTIWLDIINDFRNNCLKSVYTAKDVPSVSQFGTPKSNVFSTKKQYDWEASLLALSRGCFVKCDWCNIPVYQRTNLRLRPIDDVVSDFKMLSGQIIYICDDITMLGLPQTEKYLMAICERIEEYNVKLFLSSSLAINTNPLFLDAIAKAGTKMMYIVFASDIFSAKFHKKDKAVWNKAVSLVKMIEDRGVIFYGSFGVGFDCMYDNQFDLILEFCEKADVKMAEFFIATPFPNTPMWHKVKQENRLYQPVDWKKFNCANIVFKPEHVSEQQLLEGFLLLWKEFYRKNDFMKSLGRSLNFNEIVKAMENEKSMRQE